MAKIIKDKLSDSCTIFGLTQKELFTLMEIVRKEAMKAADPDNKEYADEEKTKKVLSLSSDIQSAYLNPVLI